MTEEKHPEGLAEDWVDFESLPEGDGVVVVSPDRRILSANLQAERILKLGLAKGDRFDLNEVMTDPYRPQAEQAILEALRGGHSHSDLVAEVSFHSGLPVLLVFSISPLYDLGNRIIGAVLTFRDNCTGSRGSEGKATPIVGYDSLFEQLAEGIFTINTRWRITAFNQRAQEITGFKREEVLGKFCWDIFKSDLCRTNCPLKLTMETGVVYTDQDVRIFLKGGRQQSILVNTSVIKNKRGLPVGAVETFRPLSVSDRIQGNDSNGADSKAAIVGESPSLARILRSLPDVAASDATVLIQGESGTGKELFAKAIHRQSPRALGPFVAVNCSALAETLLESELFGHVKGAFTGAINSKVGRFELARGGTLFLDEIGEVKPDIQVKLLRVIEEKTFERVGGNRPISMDARIIAATNKNLFEEVERKRFREDLFYRLRTVPLYLPPLRERISDIPLLVNHFVAKFNKKLGKNVRGIDPKIMRRFNLYSWPGNIRELERVLEHAFVFVKGPIITASHLPELYESPSRNLPESRPEAAPCLWEDGKLTIERALEKTRGQRGAAARLLGISRTSLWRKMKAYGLI